MTTTNPSTPTTPDTGPVLRVISPHATPEDIAAIITVLTALSGDTPTPTKTPRHEWNAPHRHHRHPHHHGPGGWRASALP
ncbi:acyl-CoA carboxylase epsilon subunit [Nocardioides sp. C4-1]|uniref:acyl-CoA carboxylase epsilon subunit n=1 Tax=Nocardioides sp. C4-1 TaxID=3151851 RepID=UPI003266A2F4